MRWNLQEIEKLIEGDFDEKQLPKGVEIIEEGNVRKVIVKMGQKKKLTVSKVLPPLKKVTSKFVGIFKKRRRVKEGKLIKAGRVLGVIKHLNLKEEVQMPEDGIIKGILADNGPVQYGTPLFSYRPIKKEKLEDGLESNEYGLFIG